MLPKRYSPGPPIGGNRVRVFRDGDETFPAMLQAIQQAERYICLETYILRDDKTGWEFGAALADKARHGVEVSLMYDGFGSISLGSEYLEHLTGNGVRLYEYHPVMPWRKGFDINRRDHRKQLIIDGCIGFVGGLNIGDEYRSHDGEAAWRDTHVEICGPAVQKLFRFFMFTWLRQGGAPFHWSRYRESPEPMGDTHVRVLANRRHTSRGAIRRAYLAAFENSKHQILLTNSYFVPDGGIRKALRSAAVRGVRVALLLAGNSDVALLQMASRHYYKQLLEDGLEIYEWTRSNLHAKTAVVDNDWATVGSYNLNFRSMFHNLEINLMIEEEAAAKALQEMFWQDVAKSEVIDHDFVSKMSNVDRAAGQVAAAFRYWL